MLSRNHLLLVYFVCLIWGYNFIAIVMALDDFGPFSLTVIRFVVVLLVLFPFLRQPLDGQWIRLALVCLFNGGFHFALLFLSLRLAEQVGSIAVLFQTYVPMSAVIAAIWLNERLGLRHILAIVIAFAGVLTVSLDSNVIDHLDAVAIVLVSALFLATGSVMMRNLRNISAYSYQAWTAVFSIPVLLPLALWLEPSIVTQIANAALPGWSGVLYSALLASIVGHGLFYYLVQRNPVSTVTPHLLTVPVLAVILGVWLRDDPFTLRLLIGGSMVLVGVFLIATGNPARKQAGQDIGAN